MHQVDINTAFVNMYFKALWFVPHPSVGPICNLGIG
jgi:hypothetical protein